MKSSARCIGHRPLPGGGKAVPRRFADPASRFHALEVIERNARHWFSSGGDSREADNQRRLLADTLAEIEKRFSDLGFFKDAEPRFEALTNLMVNRPGADLQSRVTALSALASAQERAGDTAAAESAWRRAVAWATDGDPGDKGLKRNALEGLSRLLLNEERTAEAVELLGELHALRMDALEEDPDAAAAAATRLAGALCESGQPDQAVDVIAKTRRRLEKKEPDEPIRLAFRLREADALRLAKRWADAQEIYVGVIRDMVSRIEKAEGLGNYRENLALALTAGRSAGTLLMLDDSAKAEAMYRLALTAWERTLPGVVHDYLADIYGGLEESARRQGKRNDALKYAARRMEVRLLLEPGRDETSTEKSGP